MAQPGHFTLAGPEGLPEEPGPAALGSARLLPPAVRHSSFHVPAPHALARGRRSGAVGDFAPLHWPHHSR